MASQITGVSFVCSTVCSGADQRIQTSSAWLALCEGKSLGRHEMFAFNDVIMEECFMTISPMPRRVWFCGIQDVDDGNVLHDDVIKWKHFPRYWPVVRGIHRSPVNSWHKGQWCGALMISLICDWINNWVKNNREAGDLIRHHAHYDVIVMKYSEESSEHMEDWFNFFKVLDSEMPSYDIQSTNSLSTYESWWQLNWQYIFPNKEQQ